MQKNYSFNYFLSFFIIIIMFFLYQTVILLKKKECINTHGHISYIIIYVYI